MSIYMGGGKDKMKMRVKDINGNNTLVDVTEVVGSKVGDQFRHGQAQNKGIGGDKAKLHIDKSTKGLKLKTTEFSKLSELHSMTQQHWYFTAYCCVSLLWHCSHIAAGVACVKCILKGLKGTSDEALK